MSASLEDIDIAFRRSFPRHGAAACVGAHADGLPANTVGEQIRDLVTDRVGIAKWNQDAAPVREQLACVPVGRRDDRLAEPEAVGERTGGHLRFMQIGRDVDIAHGDECEQCRAIDELIEEDDVVFDADRSRPLHELFPVRLAFAAHEVRVRCPQHHVDRFRAAFQNARHGIDHHFDALVGREQAEREHDRFVLVAQGGFRRVGLCESRVGNTVRYDLDLAGGHAVHGSQELAALLRHHDELRGNVGDCVQDRSLGP